MLPKLISYAPPEILFQINEITKILKSEITKIDTITMSSHFCGATINITAGFFKLSKGT